jgi:hypothetical protein
VTTLRILGTGDLRGLTDVGNVIVRCSIVVVFVQSHTDSIYAMQRVENIESSDLCQHCNSLKRSAPTQQCILLEAGQCSHCSCPAIHSLLPLRKSRSIAFRLSSSSSHQFLGWVLRSKGHSQAKAFFRPKVYDALTLLHQIQGSQ